MKDDSLDKVIGGVRGGRDLRPPPRAGAHRKTRTGRPGGRPGGTPPQRGRGARAGQTEHPWHPMRPSVPEWLNPRVPGGAGWTRTTDNAIMSRALYHLSYGTVEEMLASGLYSRLQLALLLPVLVYGDALSLVHFLPARNEW